MQLAFKNYIPLFKRLSLLVAFLPIHFFSFVSAQVNVSFDTDKEGGCPPFTIQFTSNVSGAGPNAVYQWDFGNGNSGSIPHPTSVYTESKNYQATLTVFDQGKSFTFSKTISGYNKPVVDFSVLEDKGCIPATIHFKSNSDPGSGSLERFYWDFGDGTTQEDYSENSEHTYMMLLKPSVTLTVSNSFGCNNSVTKTEVAEIFPSINSSFTANKEVLCKVSDGVQFTNNSTGPGILSYEWDFGDGQTSVAKNPSYVFNKEGIYTVSLTVKNNVGCSVTSTQVDYLNVANYKAGFTSPALICKDQTVYFESTSSPYPSSTTWLVDHQDASWYFNGLYYTFNDTLQHLVQFVNMFGACPDTASLKIQVKPVLELKDFDANLLNICGAPATVKFADHTPGAVQWNWVFNYNYSGNSKSSLQSPSHTYNSAGNYLVTLNVSNKYGCTSAASKMININTPQAFISNIMYDDSSSYCGYQKMKMSVSSSSDEIKDYKWVFSNGIIKTEKEPELDFTTPANYTVYLEFTTVNGCKGISNTMPFTVYQKPRAEFTSLQGTNICGNTPVTFNYTGGSAITNLSWTYEGDFNFVSSDSRIIQYNSAGTFGVALIAYNGNCSDTIEKPNYISVAPPFPKIAGIQNTCEGQRGKIEFTHSSKDATGWKWEWGDGKSEILTSDQAKISHEYAKTGSYKVVLSTTNGSCTVKDSVIAVVLLKQSPVLALSKTAVCGNESIPFAITGLEKDPISQTGYYHRYSIQRWEYEDGSDYEGYASLDYDTYFITSAKGAIIPYNQKTGKLRVITQSNYFGCADTSNVVPIQLKGAYAAFSVEKDKQCFTEAMKFNDASVAQNNTITSWTWDFGDGNSETFTQGGAVSHTYSNPGSYNVTLTVTDAGGCSSKTPPYSQAVEVYGPKAAFVLSGTNVPLNSTIEFYNYSQTYGSNNVQYSWNLGDGYTDTWESGSHTYPYSGDYTVKLKARDLTTGCSSEAEAQTIVVRYFNTAFQYSTSFITASACAPVVANFVNTSYDYTKILWDFGDGATLENMDYPSHVYKDPGTYIVTLFVHGYNGLKGEYKDTIVIHQPTAKVKVNPAQLCLGQEVNFKAEGIFINQYIWDFGDGNVIVSADSAAKHIYNNAGQLTPRLLITDINGCTGVAAANKINIRPAPVATITPDQPRLCEGQSLQLKATGGTHYSWEASPGITHLNSSNPSVSPMVTTTYHVEVKDDIGCSTKGSQTVYVVQKERLNKMNNLEICSGENVQLSASGASTYQWIKETNWLSGTTISNPVAKPEHSIQYTVVGSDAYKCFSDTSTVQVAVHPLPRVNAGNDVSIQAGASVQLNAIGSPDVVDWKWLPTVQLSCENCAAPLAKPYGDTEYKIRVGTIHGCTAEDVVKVKVLCEESTVYIPNAFTPNGDGRNDRFIIHGIGLVKRLIIYDRYGKKVYERSDFEGGNPSVAWDGTQNGQLLNTGTYVYFAEMRCATGEPFFRKGSITLIR